MNRDRLSGIRVVLLSGEEFQRSERLREIIDAAVEDATRDFNLDVFTDEDFRLETVSDIVLTFPMMAERRVVVVRNFDRLEPGTREEACKVFKETPETTLVIVEGEKVSLSPRPPAKFLLAESFKPIYENRLPAWIQERFSMRGKRIEKRATALLMNNIGIGLRELDSEIEKISVGVGDADTVTEEDVARIVGGFMHDTVYNFCNAVGRMDFHEAAGILIRLMESEKNREMYYIGSLAAHIMKIAEYNGRRKRGVSHEEAMKEVVSNRFFWDLNRMNVQVRNYGPGDVRRTLALLARTESKLKKFTLDKRLFMEFLVPLLVKERRRGRP